MNVLLLSPFEKNIGGITKWTSNVIDCISANNYKNLKIDILPLNRKKTPSLMTSKLQRIFRGICDYLNIYKQFKDVLKKNKYDIVHINSSASYGLYRDILFLKYLRKKKIKGIIHFHFGRIPELAKQNNREWKNLKKVMKMSSKVILMDKKSFITLKDLGYNNISLVPNPLDGNINNIIKKYNNIDRKKGRVLYAGHCVKTKGVYELVEACKGIESIKLKLVGHIDDDVKNDLYQIAGNNSIDWLDITGNMPYEDLIQEMLQCEIFVLPSYSEGFPNVILEAMACGCAIIATNVGAISEMLDYDGKNCGILIKPRNVNEIRNAIKNLLNSNAKYGESAQQKVYSSYSSHKVVEQLISIWYSLN